MRWWATWTAVGWLAAPVLAQDDATRVFAVLDAEAVPGKAAAALSEAGLDGARVAAALRGGRTYPAESAGTQTWTIAAGERTTRCDVIVPAGYDPARRWPLVVALHGLGGDCRQMTQILGPFVDTTGVILASPTATDPPDVSPFVRDVVWRMSPRRQWWCCEQVGFPIEAVRAVKRRFNVDEDRVFVTGYSMGGFGSWNLSLRHWDVFAGAAPMAGGLEPGEGVNGKDRTLRRLLDNGPHLPFFVVHGARDPLVPCDFSRWNVDALEERGAKVAYHEVPNAGHILPRAEFARLLPELMRFFAEQRRPALPRDLRHVALAPSHGFAGWVRVDATTGPAEVRARFPEDPTAGPIEITTTGVTGLSLFIPDDWLGGKPVPAIRLNGATVTAESAAPLDALADAWRAREDRTRVFVHRLTLRVPAAAGVADDF